MLCIGQCQDSRISCVRNVVTCSRVSFRGSLPLSEVRHCIMRDISVTVAMERLPRVHAHAFSVCKNRARPCTLGTLWLEMHSRDTRAAIAQSRTPHPVHQHAHVVFIFVESGNSQLCQACQPRNEPCVSLANEAEHWLDNVSRLEYVEASPTLDAPMAIEDGQY